MAWWSHCDRPGGDSFNFLQSAASLSSINISNTQNKFERKFCPGSLPTFKCLYLVFAVFHTLWLNQSSGVWGNFSCKYAFGLINWNPSLCSLVLMRWKNLIILNVHARNDKRASALDKGKIDVMDKFATMCILFLSALFILELTGQNINALIAFGA